MPATKQDSRDKDDLSSLLGTHDTHPAYGYRRLGIALQWGANKTRRLMALASVVPLGVKRRQPWPKEVAESQIASEDRRNLLKERGLIAAFFGHIWAEDFTYLMFQGKWYYLATIIDLYSRKIVGWALSDHHTTDLIVDALFDALSSHKPPVILHQDQGSEYCSERYDVIALSIGIETSFSQKGHPWENGFQESFYRYFKIELGAKKLDRFGDIGEFSEAIARQMHYYNNERIHSSLGMSPIDFSISGLPPRNSEKHKEICTKKLNIFQQMVTGVRDTVFGILGA